MKTAFLPSLLFLGALSVASALLLTGCNETHANSPEPAAAVPAATYKAGFGLRLAPAARDFVGLATAEFNRSRLPAAAVLRTVKGDFVYVANGEWFLRTPVILGIADADATSMAIADGLYDGDTVVTQGARALWLAELSATNGGVGCADGH